MDFERSADQDALVEAISSFCAGRMPVSTVRELAGVGGVRRSLWKELAEMGVFSLAVPEADGGVGLGWSDATLVAEVLGRHLIPGPVVDTMNAAGLVDGALSGEAVVTMIERPSAGVAIIEYLDASDVVVVFDEVGVWSVPAGDCVGTPMRFPLDPLTPVSSVATLAQGVQLGDAELARVLRRRGVVLTSALQLGLAAGATDLAVEYAKDRHQFGKPIGQFQAVKHLCADMTTKVELARAGVYNAGVCLDHPEVDDPDEAAAVAAIVAADAGDFCGKNGIQVHGGMGYTWEVDAHLYLKRSWVLDHAYGSADEHAEFLASRL